MQIKLIKCLEVYCRFGNANHTFWLGKPSNEKNGKSLFFYQTEGGGSTPKPNYFRVFFGYFLISCFRAYRSFNAIQKITKKKPEIVW